MNGGRSDASTSTDDVKGRPLCLFYFTHPFGVLSPEPPTVAAAPPHVARAFVNMEPVSPFFWPSAAAAASATAESYQATSPGTTLNYDIGNTTVHDNPVNVLSVARTRQCSVDFPSHRDSMSSSLFSSDVWFTSSSSSCADFPRRMVPYTRILPPLRLPSPRDVSDCSSDDVWPRKGLPEKFSLPPIELPATTASSATVSVRGVRRVDEPSSMESVSVREVRRRRLGVRKQRRKGRTADVRRMVTCLLRRAVNGGPDTSPSPALQELLHTIREAWAEPRSLWERCRALSRTYQRDNVSKRDSERGSVAGAMPTRALLAELPPRPDASLGLLHRRYSVPETIMRKYRLAQQRSDSEESGNVTHHTVASACVSPPREANCSPCDSSHRFLRCDRELMRKSALLRRMWARPSTCCCCDDARETRSLDGSRSELRHLSGFSPRRSPAPPTASTSPDPTTAAGWASPKRQRLHVPDRAAADLSDSSYHSHRAGRGLSSYIQTTTDPFTDSEALRLEVVTDSRGSPPTSERATAEPDSVATPPDTDSSGLRMRSYTDSETFSTLMSTAKETNGSPERVGLHQLSSNGHIEGHISERSGGVENDDRNLLPYDRPLTIEAPAPPYELLEIVVSETTNSAVVPAIVTERQDKTSLASKSALTINGNKQNINIDEYVSNILVESLNSLTDQLEYMNASIGSDRKMNIVEKEIKVKLQNTGMNTIVHLSPTSNNQIIFGNEELCNDGCKDECNNPSEQLLIRDELHSAESNNNLISSAGSHSQPPPLAHIGCGEVFKPLLHDNVNRAVLQQIQKLFQEELHSLEEGNYDADVMPGISHIEISNVDVYIDDNSEPGAAARGSLEITTRAGDELIGGVGTGNYFRDGDDAAVVPRFSAFPHTESMEVNTSSSEDAEAAYSDCTSLVDSLDDPNSPRVALLRRAPGPGTTRALARSAVDVLDLLPEDARTDSCTHRDRSEAFFIRIKDDDCNCEKEDVKVAEYMPEKIKQRLYRRHRKRELRMECARRSKVKQLKKELERRRFEELARARRQVERDCMAIVNALIDDVIAKIAQDEYKCMRIKQRNAKLAGSKSEENLAKRNRRKDLEAPNDRGNCNDMKNDVARHSSNKENHKSERHHICEKLRTRPSLAPSERLPRRLYQKSEIHEGEKCIEILEILEYVNRSQSSPETTNSDENQNQSSKCKKSRIPVPVYERIQRSPKDDVQMRLTGGDCRRSPCGDDARSGHLLANMLLEALADERHTAPAPVPQTRSRSNSLRFKRIFDIIPEERSSLSFDSSVEDAEHARRASAPDAIALVPPAVPPRTQPVPAPAPAHIATLAPTESPRRIMSMRSAGTSPPTEAERRHRSQTTMTSPCNKSASTSPLRPPPPPPRTAREGYRKSVPEAEKTERGPPPPAPVERRSERRRVRTIQGEVTDPIIVGRDRTTTDASTSNGRKHVARITSESHERRRVPAPAPVGEQREPSDSLGDADAFRTAERRDSHASMGGGGGEGAGSSSDSSGGSLLCSLAPRWLAAPARQRRRARRSAPSSPPASPTEPPPRATRGTGNGGGGGESGDGRGGGGGGGGGGGWSVTVAGSCRAALPADVEMRLRFPYERHSQPHPHPHQHHQHAPVHNLHTGQAHTARYQECPCVQCGGCACATCDRDGRAQQALRPALAAAPAAGHPAPQAHQDGTLTLTMKKEAQDSSILASKSLRKSSELLPELETYRATRSKVKSSVKTRRGCSLHCWLPGDEPAPIGANNGLSVLGCAIVPELKPRVPTMSERDLTRVYTPRHYLRS